jgi:hypothetical protein
MELYCKRQQSHLLALDDVLCCVVIRSSEPGLTAAGIQYGPAHHALGESCARLECSCVVHKAVDHVV